MASLTSLNNYAIDMADWNLPRIPVGANGYVRDDNVFYDGVLYSDVVGYGWSLKDSSYLSIFGGNFTTVPNEFGTPIISTGIATSYIEQYWNGASWESSFHLSGSTVDATQIYPAALTSSTVDDYQLWANMLSGNDTIMGSSKGDTLLGYAGNDTITGGFGNDIIDGGAGSDTAAYTYVNLADILISKNKGGGYTTFTNNAGTDVLTSIETLAARDGSSSITTLYDAQEAPTINYLENGEPATVTLEKYEGGVSWLDYQFIGNADRQVIQGSGYSEFMNLLGGTDAVDGRGGDDVLDGGTGSNFMTGGVGKDTFFIDGRGFANTWSTVTDLTTDDAVNLWGWQDGISQLIGIQENLGASGFKGLTYFYDLDGNGEQETKLTFTGLTSSDFDDPCVNAGAAVPYLSFPLATIG